jgi:hypothetical protein
MPNSQNPSSPNYVPGVGRLVTDRFDFQKHVDGAEFRHNATQIDLFPTLVINSVTTTTVEQALQQLVAVLTVPTINQATIGTSTSNLGIVTLGGDLSGPSSTALSPKVSGLQGHPVLNIAPAPNQVLIFTAGAWTPTAAPPPGGAASGDLSGTYPGPTVAQLQGHPVSAAVPGVGQLLEWTGAAWTPTTVAALPPNGAASGDLAGTYPSPTVAKLQTIPVSAVAPTSGQALTFNGASWAPASPGSSARAYFGSGADGVATFDGISVVLGLTPSATKVYTMDRNIVCTDLTVGALATIKTNGFIIMCTGTLTVNGIINNSGEDAVGTTAGPGTVWAWTGGGSDGGSGLHFSGAQSGVSFVTAVGGDATVALGGAGGAGGNIANLGGDRNNINPTAFDITRFTVSNWLSGNTAMSGTAISAPTIISWGGGTGGGGGASPGGGPPIDGGGGGGGAGTLLICANVLAGSGILQANGGAGANTAGWAGGGGGGGGCVVIIYNTKPSWLGIASAGGGAAGSGPSGTGSAGAAGTVVYCQG